MELADRVSFRTRVLAIKREPTPPGVDPQQGRILEVLDLGPNVLVKKGRHVLVAHLAGSGAAQLPAGNTYLDGDGWHLQYMSLGSNDDPGSTADTADEELDCELEDSLKAFTAAAAGDVDEVLNEVLPFCGLGDTSESHYTHVAWRCLYASGEGNGNIRELGLWFADGTTNPEGDFTPSNPEGLSVRGPLASRKVLSGVIEKTSAFALEFVWVWMG
jgi:hypothetical protein